MSSGCSQRRIDNVIIYVIVIVIISIIRDEWLIMIIVERETEMSMMLCADVVCAEMISPQCWRGH